MESLRERIEQLENAAKVTGATVEGGELRLRLPNQAVVTVPTHLVRSLKNLSEEQQREVLVTDAGRVLLWPTLGISIDVEGLLEAVTGLQTLKAAQRKGGAARTDAKGAASRANGAKGGRPRKTIAA